MRISDAIRRYRNQLLAQGSSDYTVRGAKSALGQLATFLQKLDVTDIAHLNREVLMQYREELGWRLTKKGTPLSVRSQLELLTHVTCFCRFVVAEGWLTADPSADIPRPKKPRRLPRGVMDTNDIIEVLGMPDVRTLSGYRDKVILEVLYSTALRREEISNLELSDVDTDGGYVFVREGKGGKDRVAPLGSSVCDLVKSYLLEIRPQWPNAKKDKHLFLNRWGKRLGPNAVWAIVRKYGKAAEIDKPVAPHSMRHACATHMLRNGAPIRQLQEMLGHTSLESTQVYTHVTINDLRAMHKKFHPREQDKSEDNS